MAYTELTMSNNGHMNTAPSIFYLIGLDRKDGCKDVIATYSTKTKRLLIKGANKYMPNQNVLIRFVNYAEGYRNEQRN